MSALVNSICSNAPLPPAINYGAGLRDKINKARMRMKALDAASKLQASEMAPSKSLRHALATKGSSFEL